jgi:hypothetical protein
MSPIRTHQVRKEELLFEASKVRTLGKRAAWKAVDGRKLHSGSHSCRIDPCLTLLFSSSLQGNQAHDRA